MGVAFDVRRLPYAYETKTTEILIDALFNPAKMSLKHEENPFTVYEPPSSASSSHSAGITPRVGTRSNVNKPAEVVGLGLGGVLPLDRNTTIGKCHGSRMTTTASSSVYSTGDSSVHTMLSSSSKSRSRGRGSQSDSHHGHSVWRSLLLVVVVPRMRMFPGVRLKAGWWCLRGRRRIRRWVDCVGGGNARSSVRIRILDFLGWFLCFSLFFFFSLCDHGFYLLCLFFVLSYT